MRLFHPVSIYGVPLPLTTNIAALQTREHYDVGQDTKATTDVCTMFQIDRATNELKWIYKPNFEPKVDS